MCVYIIYTNIYIIYIIYWVSNDSNRSVVFSRNSSFPTTRTSWSCECFQVRVPWSVAEIAPPLSTTGRRPWSIVETCWNVRNDVFWIISLFFLHSFIFLHLSTVFCGQDLECCAEQRVRNSTASIYHLFISSSLKCHHWGFLSWKCFIGNESFLMSSMSWRVLRVLSRCLAVGDIRHQTPCYRMCSVHNVESSWIMVNCVKNFKLFVSDLNFMDETGWKHVNFTVILQWTCQKSCQTCRKCWTFSVLS